jgi:hypothetical protein
LRRGQTLPQLIRCLVCSTTFNFHYKLPNVRVDHPDESLVSLD